MLFVYTEGIYVDYRYYEARYEDTVMGTGNTAGSDPEVQRFESLRAHLKISLQCTFCFNVIWV